MKPTRKAKLFVKAPDGEWKEIKAQIGEPVRIEPSDDPDIPFEIPGLRDFVFSLTVHEARPLGPLDVPPMDVDPMRN